MPSVSSRQGPKHYPNEVIGITVHGPPHSHGALVAEAAELADRIFVRP